MGRLALVTGATGFIGRHLVDQLTQHGWNVRALVRPTSDVRHLRASGVELFIGDLEDPDSLAPAVAGSDTVFHLAALTAARSEEHYQKANTEGVRAVVNAILTHAVRPRRLIYLSSYAACGPSAHGTSRPSDAEPAPLSAYGRTKLAGEVTARAAEDFGLEVLVLRAPAVYGPGDRALLPYFRLIRWHLAPVPGGADRRIHLVFAPDLAGAIRRAADSTPGTFAIAEPVEHRWSDVVATIAGVMGRPRLQFRLPASVVRAAAAGSEALGRLSGRPALFNRDKAEEMLAPGWVCSLDGSEVLLPPDSVTPLRMGVEQTLRWYIRQGWL